MSEVRILVNLSINRFDGDAVKKSIEDLKETKEYYDVCDDPESLADFLEEKLFQNENLNADIKVFVEESEDYNNETIVIVSATD